MLTFGEEVKEIQILDKDGKPLLAGDHDRRFFEASWMHKYKDKYYFSYSTGDTHYLVYAIGDNPYGPFTYQGVILNPVLGWTTHHSIVEFNGHWYLFFHDSTCRAARRTSGVSRSPSSSTMRMARLRPLPSPLSRKTKPLSSH